MTARAAPRRIWEPEDQRGAVRHTEVNSRRSVFCSGPLDLRALDQVASDEVGGQPLVTKGIQPPPPEPDGHVSVHPALQTQDLLGVYSAVLQA